MLAALALLPLCACPTPSKPTLRVQPELAPKFDLRWDPQQGLGSPVLQLTLDTEEWGEALVVGGYPLEAGGSLDIAVENPFSAGRKVVGSGPTGSDFLAFQPYSDLPVPPYGTLAVVPEYSPADGGTWLHIIVGAEPKSGLRLLVARP